MAGGDGLTESTRLAQPDAPDGIGDGILMPLGDRAE